MASIFISYRRDDSLDITGRITDRITARFGKGAVFKDVDSLVGGQDFPTVLRSSIQRNTVMLVIIGRTWLATTQERAVDPNDFARIEIETALQRRATIIPVLIQGAQMPAREQLPPSIADLANRHATVVRADPDFTPDMNGVLRAIAPHMRSAGQRLAQLSVLVILAVVAALLLTHGPGDSFGGMNTTCSLPDDGFRPIAGNLYDPAKTDGIGGQIIRIRGSGNAEAVFGEARVRFDAVNGTCTSIDRGGGGWQVTKPNEIGVTDFSLAYDKGSQLNRLELVDTPLGVLPYVIIVGKGVYQSGIHNLRREQIVGIFDKQYTNWAQLGGPDAPIDPIKRIAAQNDISGTFYTFEKAIMYNVAVDGSIPGADNSLATIVNTANNDYTISFIALPALDFYVNAPNSPYQGKVFPITINGHGPTANEINSGTYEFWDVVHAFTYNKPNVGTKTGKAVQAMLDLVTNRDFQAVEFPVLHWLPYGKGIQRQQDIDCRNSIDVCKGA